MKKILYILLIAMSQMSCAQHRQEVHLPEKMLDSLMLDGKVLTVWDINDTIPLVEPSLRLTPEDYREVADELGVEVAAIKAVVEIEAGLQHKGFWKEGHPVINFDLPMFQRMAARNKVNLSKAKKKSPVIFSRPNVAKYGSQQAAQQARLDAAMAVDSVSAIDGTFWGMFQIGGFNWKKCGTASRADFVNKMSSNERAQLELFANFLRSTGLDKQLKAKNWSAFARGYNGASYAKRGYHTRMAKAYKKYKKEKEK